MKLQRIFAMTAVAAFALSTLTGCPWEQEDDASSAPSSSSSRPSHDSDNDSAPDTPSSTPDEPEVDQGFTYNEEENCYTITSSEGLMNWAKQENVMTADCTLDADVEVSNWTLGNNYNVNYTGTFNGNGKTISGLTQPLFGKIGSGGTVKNLTIGGEISGYSGVASDNSGTIVNCTIKAAVNATGSSAGGVAGTNSGTITGCVVTGNVSGDYNTGGIVAHGTADASCYYSGTVTLGQYGIKNDAGTPVTGGWTETEINAMNAHLTDCEYVFELDTTTGQPKLVKRNSAEQAVNRLLAQFWG